MQKLVGIAALSVVFASSCFNPTVETIYPSCLALVTAVPDTESGVYTVDPDGEGGIDPFVTLCDMDTDGGGWTLIGIVSGWDDDSWTELAAWTDSTVFGDLDTANDYKNTAWSALPFDQFFMQADSYEGTKISAPGLFGGPSFASLFDTMDLVSLTGTESNWEVNVGDIEIVNDSVFFAEIQNPPATVLVNLAARNGCVLTTAYDGYFGDDQVEGYGCGPGTGVGGTPCDNDSCGDTVWEDETWFYVR